MKNAFAAVRATAASLAIASLASFAGCASSGSTTLTYLPNGETGFAINCSGSDASQNWGECYKRAGEACGAYGYDVVSKDVDTGGTAGGTLGGVLGANVKNRSMVIRCKQ